MVNFAAAPSLTLDEVADGSGFADAVPEAEPAIDLVHLSRQTFGDHELERELLTLFERQATQFEDRLSAPVAPGTNVWRAELVHTLKGSARAVGAFGVARAAETYEESLRKGESLSPAGKRLASAIENARTTILDLLTQG